MTLPTKIMHSTTAGNAPSSLLTGQIALNEQDRKLFYLDPQAAAPKSLLDQLMAFTKWENMFYNPACEVDQEHIGNAVTGVGASANQYLIDGVCLGTTGTPTARFTSQLTPADVPAGYGNCLKISTTTAQASLTTGQDVFIRLPIELGTLNRLNWGGSSAAAVSLAFYFRANRTGQYGGSFCSPNGATKRSYTFSFTYNSAGVWQYIAVTIPGDTGAFYSGVTVVEVRISLGAGSTLLTAAGTWTTGTFSSATGQINAVAATTDYAEITGQMLFRSNILVPVDRAPFMMPRLQDAVPFCERYYEKSQNLNSVPGTAEQTGMAQFTLTGLGAQNGPIVSVPFHTRKRNASGSITAWSPATGTVSKVREYLSGADIAYTINQVGENDYSIAPTQSGATGFNLGWHWLCDIRM
jgi:hypothetical protein